MDKVHERINSTDYVDFSRAVAEQMAKRPRAKKVVRVFADYCSTGVWLDDGNADPEELGISPALRLALRYWHDVWEFNIAEDISDRPGMSHRYVVHWENDGRELTRLMSAENEKYEFVYVD